MTDQQLLDNQHDVDRLVAVLEREQLIALDTEFVRVSTYFPQLCLIQVATPSAATGIDCIASIDLAGLAERLFSPQCTWIVHSARQDLEVLWQSFGRLPSRLIDTQIAASLAGFAPQQGLQSLLADTLGITLEKAFTRLDWSRRPLPQEAICYALDDVRHLIPLWHDLQRRLAALGRLEWLEQDCAALLRAPPETGLDAIWSRLKGAQSLPEPSRRAAWALLEWRETAARRLNRPRRWILSDALLVELARRGPRSTEALAAVPMMPRKLVARSSAELLQALDRRCDASPAPAASASREAERADRDRIRSLQARLKQHAEVLGIHAEVLATRRDVAALARGELPTSTSRWRAAELAKLLD